MVFEEVMIDHLEIESSLVLAESMAGKEQIAMYGIPPSEDGESDENDDHVSSCLFRNQRRKCSETQFAGASDGGIRQRNESFCEK